MDNFYDYTFDPWKVDGDQRQRTSANVGGGAGVNDDDRKMIAQTCMMFSVIAETVLDDALRNRPADEKLHQAMSLMRKYDQLLEKYAGNVECQTTEP